MSQTSESELHRNASGEDIHRVHGLWLGLSMLYLIMSMLENLHPIPKGLTKSLGRPTAHLAIFEKLPSDIMNNILVQLDVKSFRDFRNANAKAHISTRDTYH
ncbi:hypothetical protein FPHYL_7628 [Fusarium phyllophilum]|uniref:F-box domain-containing protein n=1 Tax=Fusarium phyllophilum TaxID=47803 RepID=A0A8H5N8P5_9HYPO|nr:hypothetical protein FPHYL_7628 [Fusarium phyllophilum]